MDAFKEALKKEQGAAYKSKIWKIGRFREDVLACGRLVGTSHDRYFAVDDMKVIRTYLVPDKPSRKR